MDWTLETFEQERLVLPKEKHALKRRGPWGTDVGGKGGFFLRATLEDQTKKVKNLVVKDHS